MTQFKDLAELFDPLVLPVNGKEYTIPPLSFEAGATVDGALRGEEKMGDEAFYRLLISDKLFDELLADHVPAKMIDRIARTVLTDHASTRELALTMWETGGDPKAVEEYKKAHAPNRASRRSKSTAAARKTR
ncbi:DUF7426 family protein [Humibacter sp.]|uniref:DUF7426 family protein n=1 Tax=Humibacter sp. TaxID=1940291 RepID=UPI003F805BFD